MGRVYPAPPSRYLGAASLAFSDIRVNTSDFASVYLGVDLELGDGSYLTISNANIIKYNKSAVAQWTYTFTTGHAAHDNILGLYYDKTNGNIYVTSLDIGTTPYTVRFISINVVSGAGTTPGAAVKLGTAIVNAYNHSCWTSLSGNILTHHAIGKTFTVNITNGVYSAITDMTAGYFSVDYFLKYTSGYSNDGHIVLQTRYSQLPILAASMSIPFESTYYYPFKFGSFIYFTAVANIISSRNIFTVPIDDYINTFNKFVKTVGIKDFYHIGA